jgi:quercetin dioxygenase-like cupin family protein
MSATDKPEADGRRSGGPGLDIRPPPEAAEARWQPLVSGPFARAWDTPGADVQAGAAIGERLKARVQASHSAEAGLVTVRRRRAQPRPLGAGVSEELLYLAKPGLALRPGEPQRARLIQLAAGSEPEPDLLAAAAQHREWLVLSGELTADGLAVGERDYIVTPAGSPSPAWRAQTAACLFVRESLPADSGSSSSAGLALVRDAEAGWPDFAPGIQRRVLWQHAGQAAMLYYAQPGAMVPNHMHGHDEECLMVQGELFLDDVLLQPGDYQLAPAGSGHRLTHTDTGVVIYAHGDLDLQFVA